MGNIGRQEIEQRLRDGGKATHIARETELSLREVIRIAKDAGIALKRGRQKVCNNQVLYSKHIDAKFGPGTSEKLLKLRERLTYDDIGLELGGMSRGSAHHISKFLAGGAPKPVVPHKPMKWQRTDITTERVRESAERCSSVAEMGRELRASDNVIYKRARDGNITLPDGRLNLTESMPDKRPDLTREKMQILANTLPSISVMARALHTDSATIKRRAKRFGISLPRYGRPRLAP